MRRRAGGMEPDNFSTLGDFCEDVAEFRLVQRFVIHVREKLKADGVVFVDHPVDFRDGGGGIVHR